MCQCSWWQETYTNTKRIGKSSWEFKVSKAELTNLLDSRKRKFEAQLHEETSK